MDRDNADVRHERGVTLPLVAIMLLTLIGLAALGTDLGWQYVNAARVQRAADAAALAGVIHMPESYATAVTTGDAVAAANGYTVGVNGTTVDVNQVLNEPSQLEVTISTQVDTFFMKVFGFNTVTVKRSATAEYLPPIPLGSPDNQFGNSCKPGVNGCSGQPNFWANIHGKYTDTVMGDAFSSYCDGSSSGACSVNGTYRSRGYLYGVEKGSNSGFTISFLDMAFHNVSGGQTTSDSIRTGDRGCESGAWGNSNSSACGQTVTANLYYPDPTPLDVTDNTLLCSYTWNPVAQVAESAAYNWQSPAGCFTQSAATNGVYVLQIVVNEPSQANYSGLNRYSLRTQAGSKLYGLGDFSIYNNTLGTTNFYVAEVAQWYAGKTFVVELYDPGESSNNGTLQMIDPSGNVFSGTCRVYSRNRNVSTWTLQSTPGTCQETVSPSEYNGRWLKFEMDLPTTYSCSNCWWQVKYDYPFGSVQDTTTWRAYVIGNPVHLIPNGP